MLLMPGRMGKHKRGDELTKVGPRRASLLLPFQNHRSISNQLPKAAFFLFCPSFSRRETKALKYYLGGWGF